MDVFGYLEACKHRYGLDAADIWNGQFPTLDEDYILNIRDALRSREMVLADLCCDHCHIWADDPDVREQNYRNALKHLEIGKTLGARFVRFDAGGFNYTEWPEEVFDHIVERYREYAQYAYDNGFTMGAENHWGPVRRWSNLKRLYEAVDHPAFRLSYHLGAWVGTDEDVRQADREIAPWVGHTHVDWPTCTTPELLHERLANLWNVGYDGYYSIEHYSGVNEYSRVAIQLHAVRDKLEEFRDLGMEGWSGR